MIILLSRVRHQPSTPSTRAEGIGESLQRSLPSSIRARTQRNLPSSIRADAAMRAVVLALAACGAAALKDSRVTPCPLYTPKITLNQPPRVATLAMG